MLLARIRPAAPAAALLPLVLVLAPAAAAQATAATATVGPEVAPLGAPIQVTFTNTTSETQILGACPFHVDDGAEELVWQPVCYAIAYVLEPGQSKTFVWDQTDLDGEPVGPGQYYVVVPQPSGAVTATPVLIAAEAAAAIAPLGPAALGASVDLALLAPAHPFQPYRLGVSLGASVGIPTCGGTLPLDLDPLLALSQDPAMGILSGALAHLDGAGQSTASSLHVPDLPELAGLQVHLAFAVLEPEAACPVAAISEPVSLELQPASR